MLIDKMYRHLFRESLDGKDSAYIIYPTSFLSDVFDDLTLTTKTEERIYEMQKKIDGMEGIIGGEAPVSSINGKVNDVYLNKSDLKRFDDDQNGLNRVDNTSDAEKMPSDLFKNEWNRIFSIIKNQFDNMNNLIRVYKNHVTADDGTPTKLNPHRTSLLNGIYYNGKIVKVDPNKFIQNHIVRDAIYEHNISKYAHPNIQEIVHDTQGILSIVIYNMFDTVSNLERKISENTTASILNKISIHNDDITSHMIISDTIKNETIRLQEIYNTPENDRYEYEKYKTDAIDMHHSYTREYPSIKSIDSIFFKLPLGLSFYDSDIIPSIILDPNDQRILVRSSNNDVHNIRVNSYDINFDQMVLFVNRDAISFDEISIDSSPIFGILSKSGIFGYKNIEDMMWNTFILNLIHKHNSNVVSVVGYTDAMLTKPEYDVLYPQTSLTGLYFSKDGVFIYHNKTFNSSESYKIWSPFSNQLRIIDGLSHDNWCNTLILVPISYRDKFNHKDQIAPLMYDITSIGMKVKEDNFLPFGVPSCYPQDIELVNHIDEISYQKSIEIEDTHNCASIGTLQLRDYPIRNEDGSISKSIIDTDTGSGWESNSIKCSSVQQYQSPFDVIFKSIIF